MNVSALSIAALGFLGAVYFICEILEWRDAYRGNQKKSNRSRAGNAGTEDRGADAVHSAADRAMALSHAQRENAARSYRSGLLGEDFELDDDAAGLPGDVWDNIARYRDRGCGRLEQGEPDQAGGQDQISMRRR